MHMGNRMFHKTSYMIMATDVMSRYQWCLCEAGSFSSSMKEDFNGLVQERRNSSALAMELRLSCTNPSISTAHTISMSRNDTYVLTPKCSYQMYGLLQDCGIANTLQTPQVCTKPSRRPLNITLRLPRLYTHKLITELLLQQTQVYIINIITM